MSLHGRGLSATFVPGTDDDYYMPPQGPVLVAPEPQRINPEMSNQIADGIEAVQNMDLNAQGPRSSTNYATPRQQHDNQSTSRDAPNFSPFPKLTNPPPNVPPSDEELESTLENARSLVLNSNDPDMQLAWAADALVYAGVCAENEERIATVKPHAARPATPRVEHQLKTDAMNIVTFLADQHHPKAEFLRGMWLEWGRFGQREDKKEAFRCYSRAADRGYARAEYRIGMLYESYNDPIKALRHYNQGVDAGDAASCYRLGMMTLRGQHGQPQDWAKAIDLIRKSAQAADENAAQGAYVYGMLLARQLPQIEVPEGYLPLDERQARINIEKAAYLKFAKAQLKMGSSYELGSLGCDFSPALSVHYNALASKQGEPEADMALSKWFLVGSEGLFPKNEELAYVYAERAAHSGLATAEFALGYFHEIGVYVPVNIDKALEWYEKASKHGNGDARGRIDGLSRKQVLSKTDHEDVAVSKIKSQHGSMRGVRPERFQQKPPKLGAVSEYSNGGSQQQPPPRGSSITPYPEDSRLPAVASTDNRPSSMAPYPLQDGPPRHQTPRLGPTGGFLNTQQPPQPQPGFSPEIRPSSAFQINPELRSNSTGPVPQGSFAGGPNPGNRPVAAQPYGLGPGPRANAGNRIASGPANSQKYPQNQYGTPGPAQQRPGMPQHQVTAPATVPQQRLDIGFSAPPDDRRNRTYGPGRPMQEQSKPFPSPQQSYGMPSFDNAGGRASVPPPRVSSRPPEGSRRPAEPSAPKPPPKVGTPSQLASTPRPPTASAHQAPPRGPKTFDEMGVPSSKQENECVVM